MARLIFSGRFRDLLGLPGTSGLESILFWHGLKSCIFHVAAESPDCPKVLRIRSLLTQSGICFSVDELSGANASQAMDADFRDGQHDLHRTRIGRTVFSEHADRYNAELSELHDPVGGKKTKVFRFKVLIDAGLVSRKEARDTLRMIGEVRLS